MDSSSAAGGSRKSTVDEIRARFDGHVERFSNLSTGQEAAMDSALCMDLITRTAAAVTPRATHVLDIGCGAGNYSLKLLAHLPSVHVTLVDLSRPMLDRAEQRLREAGCRGLDVHQQDIRNLSFPPGSLDIILAASVLHHLRSDREWEAVFASLLAWLRPGGSVWICDLLEHEHPAVHAVQNDLYGQYLTGLKDEAYRDTVFSYIADEDTPRPLSWQLDLIRRVGFGRIDVLHKHGPFAAFGAVKE